MGKIKAVIFDMDGVLVDSLPAHYKSYVRIYSRLGINYTLKEFIAKDITAGATNAIPRMLREHNKTADTKKLLREKNRITIRQRIPLNDGILMLLKELKKKKYKLAVASGGTRDFASSMLKRNKIRKYFNAVVTGQDHVKKKPHPDIFLKAAKKLSVKPSECVVIEDAHDGVAAARRANMKVIGHYQPRYKQDLSRADKIVRSITKINVKTIEKI